MAARDGTSEARRARSLAERQRIVEESLAPGASVAAIARWHGLIANLVFKWIRRSREGWRDWRHVRKEKSDAVMTPETLGPAFDPAKLLELGATSAPPPADAMVKSAREMRRKTRRGVMEISLPNDAKVLFDVGAEVLRRVLGALGVA